MKWRALLIFVAILGCHRPKNPSADQGAVVPCLDRPACRNACDGGDARACASLGLALADGVHGPSDADTAQKLLAAACSKHIDEACEKMIAFYDERDTSTMCAAGSRFACTYVRAKEWDDAEGTDSSHADEVLAKLLSDCDQGNEVACGAAGYVEFSKADMPGESITPQALAAMDRACKLRFAYVCYGLGLSQYASHDEVAAFASFSHACEVGQPQGCYGAAEMAQASEGGATPSQALAFAERGCDLGAETCDLVTKLDPGGAAAAKITTEECTAGVEGCFHALAARWKASGPDAGRRIADQVDHEAALCFEGEETAAHGGAEDPDVDACLRLRDLLTSVPAEVVGPEAMSDVTHEYRVAADAGDADE